MKSASRVARSGGSRKSALSPIEREKMARLQNAIAGLSEQQKSCLFLRAEGLRYQEIAQVIGVGTSTVGEFLRRAITRLRRASHD